MPGQRIYAVGVQHQRLFHIQQPPGQSIALLPAAKAAAHQHRVAGRYLCADRFLRGQCQPALRCGQREGHGAVALYRRNGPDIPGHPQIHKAAAAADGGLGRQHRRAGIAYRAAQTVHLAEGALVALRIPPGQDAFYIIAGDLHGGALLSRKYRLNRLFLKICPIIPLLSRGTLYFKEIFLHIPYCLSQLFVL